VSFNLIFGFTGQLSMFHAAAFGIAAYVTSLAVSMFHVSFWLGLLPAVCCTILISLLIGSICFKFKLTAFYFAVVTLAFSNLAQTLGIDIFRYKLLSFTFANSLAAIAGSLYAFYTGYIEPNYLGINQSLDIISMVLLGGRSSIIGPIAGAFVLTGLPHVIDLSGEMRAIFYGLVLILTILILPHGIIGTLASRRRA